MPENFRGGEDCFDSWCTYLVVVRLGRAVAGYASDVVGGGRVERGARSTDGVKRRHHPCHSKDSTRFLHHVPATILHQQCLQSETVSNSLLRQS